MILIIAEKPSLGRNIAAGINEQMKRRDGYLEGTQYIITWAFGHLFSLCDIETYTGPSPDGRWNMAQLPCFPTAFQYELAKKNSKDTQPDAGIKKQFETIQALCNRPDVETIVNAGDADREGEIIIRLCVSKALTAPKPIKRLWLPDQTPQTVAKALAEMQDDSEYDSLANEGFARTFIDWLYGVNLTRFATLKTGTLLRVGRVIVPIVKAIYDRDLAIRNFQPSIYYSIVSKEETKGETIELVSKQRFEKGEEAQAKALCNQYNQLTATVTNVKQKKETVFPGKLYSLSKLQNVLGKKYKMSMATSLAIVQKLYEAGYVTYPRTDSEYLATAEKDRVKQILGSIAKLGYPVAFKDGKNIFDDSKIESHSALTPTYKIPAKQALNDEEQKVYSTIFRRFVAVFCAKPCIASKTEITIDLGDAETFTLKGTVLLEEGWTKYDDRNIKDKVLPNLAKGDIVAVHFEPTEKETTPPKHYTIETLNNYLKNPFKEEKSAAKENEGSENEDDAEDYRAIFEGLELGTEATRTGIIDHARESKYIELKKDVYTLLPGGEFLIDALRRMNISMDKYKTSEMGQALKKVYHSTMTVDESVSLAKEQIQQIFDNEAQSEHAGFFGDILGTCPICGKNVIQKKSFYGCEGYKETQCVFRLPMQLCGKILDKETLRILLAKGETPVLAGFVSPKSGKEFSASLKFDPEKGCSFVFPEPRKKAPPPAPLCPLCGKPIIKGKAAYGCSGWRESCHFTIPFADEYGTWQESEIASLLAGKDVLRQGEIFRLEKNQITHKPNAMPTEENPSESF